MANKIQKIQDEENDFYSDDDLFKISSWGADLSFRELIERYQDNELIKPELQRKYVWDKTAASRFIDSLLLGLPVPSIFLAKQQDENLLIIDGYQRIMTVHDYVTGIFGGDGKTFKLSKSKKINTRWRGKAFGELKDNEQKKIKNTTIHSIIFVQQHPKNDDTSLYQVFERINTSGTTLLPQEIRNCVYQGGLNTLLFKLNKIENWRALYGSQKEDQRMRDLEFILRFFAVSSPEINNIPQVNVSLKKYLNQYMGKHINPNQAEIKKYQERFANAINFIYENIGENAFNNYSTASKKFSPNFSPTIFDSLMIATDQVMTKNKRVDKKRLLVNRMRLLNDPDYQIAITRETMRKESIQQRILKVKTLLFKA